METEQIEKSYFLNKLAKKKSTEQLSVTAVPVLTEVSDRISKAAMAKIVADQVFIRMKEDRKGVDFLKLPVEAVGAATLVTTEPDFSALTETGGVVTYNTVDLSNWIAMVQSWGESEIEGFPVDVMDWQMDAFGRRIGDKMDDTLITALETCGTTNTISPYGTLTPGVIADLIALMEADNYHMTHLLVNPAEAADLRKDETFTSSIYAGEAGLAKGEVGQCFGVKILVSSNVTAGIIIGIDAEEAAVLVEKSPLDILPFDRDDIRKHGVTARWRFGYAVIRANAVAFSSKT